MNANMPKGFDTPPAPGGTDMVSPPLMTSFDPPPRFNKTVHIDMDDLQGEPSIPFDLSSIRGGTDMAAALSQAIKDSNMTFDKAVISGDDGSHVEEDLRLTASKKAAFQEKANRLAGSTSFQSIFGSGEAVSDAAEKIRPK